MTHTHTHYKNLFGLADYITILISCLNFKAMNPEEKKIFRIHDETFNIFVYLFVGEKRKMVEAKNRIIQMRLTHSNLSALFIERRVTSIEIGFKENKYIFNAYNFHISKCDSRARNTSKHSI